MGSSMLRERLGNSKEAAKNRRVLDLQDILQRFTFDNICKISFGYDPEYLDPSLPNQEFAVAYEEATMISTARFRSFFPIVWKTSKFLNIGSEKRLKEAVSKVRQFAMAIVKEKKETILKNSENSEDLLSRFLKSGHSDEKFVTDIVISFLLAGRDTTSAALTWFFWLVHKNKQAEQQILEEVLQNRGKQGNKTEHLNSTAYEEVKDMVYTHAALCESMRLFPPVPVDIKEATSDDVLPDGMRVKKGTWVTYHPYAMGRLEKLWGPDWAKYRPERWLQKTENVVEKKWRFMPRDPYSYPVFHGGPRVCLGKEMAFLQMKRVVAGVLSRFKVVPVAEEGFEPVYVPYLTAKMHGGFPVRIEERCEFE
ncbi:cytochrome P450 94A1-like [Silene latifolia]|uniref:cytochrome P450 94A1-like n=1 Tax=Silene latifolia TaxID=37657 RepID=UPI003D76E493